MRYTSISYKGDNMTISEIITYLEGLMEEKGDIPLSCDFREGETALAYDEDIECVFGSWVDATEED
jgi:hypothetical protein